MRTLTGFLFFIAAISMQTGCSTFTPPAQMEQIKENGTYWLNYSSDRRGAIVRTANEATDSGSIKVCAEPAPDTSNNFELQGTLKKDAVGEASAQAGQSVIILPGRSSNVLSLRESLYRLCELSINRPDIPASDLMTAFNKVIIAITQYAEADAAKSAATTEAVIKSITSHSPNSNAFVTAKDTERSGFENIANGNFSAALTDFSNVEDLYPGYHNAFEIRNALKAALADGKVDETEKQALLRNIVSKWSWGAPSDLLIKIKSQIK
ncbi:hypothetical protein ACUTR7_01480 [Delftia sp. NA_296.1]|uniref:hypothetical protein n=1 Tax=Delftia sp. NA_296.1 TaxID=3415648 RepID=UPI0040464249